MKLRYKIGQWFNYHFGTHFLESESERVVYNFLDQYFYVEKQVKILYYRVDFLIGEVIIEVDGPSHSDTRDNARDAILRAHGYKVIRVKAERLWSQDRELILEKLYKDIKRA